VTFIFLSALLIVLGSNLQQTSDENLLEAYQVLESRVHQLESVNQQLNHVIDYFQALITNNKRERSAEGNNYPVNVRSVKSKLIAIRI
jgi:hypothetical protein